MRRVSPTFSAFPPLSPKTGQAILFNGRIVNWGTGVLKGRRSHPFLFKNLHQSPHPCPSGTEASQSANPRPLRARQERDEQGQKGGGKKEDPVGGMQDGGRGLLKEDNIWRK